MNLINFTKILNGMKIFNPYSHPLEVIFAFNNNKNSSKASQLGLDALTIAKK
jgi:hypothetical protein